MVALTRAAALTDYADLARSVGLDPVRMARAADVPVRALSNPDLKINAACVAALLESSAARSGLEDFGLRLARKRRLSNLGALGLVLREQATLRKAIEAIVHLSWLQNESLSLDLEESGDLAILHCRSGDGPMARQSAELTLAIMVRSLRALLGESWSPDLVCFQHPPPRSRETHRRVFLCELAFDQDFAGVAFARRDFDRPIPNADPAMAREIERYVRRLGLSKQHEKLRDKVLEIVVAGLAAGRSTADSVSEAMGFDRRTLHRKLAREGTTFRSLVDQARTRLAKAYLAENRRSLTSMAEQLGFSSLSAFSRWHKQKFGCSPTRASVTAGKTRPR